MKKYLLALVLMVAMASPAFAVGDMAWYDGSVNFTGRIEYVASAPDGDLIIRNMNVPFTGEALFYGLYPYPYTAFEFILVTVGQDADGDDIQIVCYQELYAATFTYNPHTLATERLHAIVPCRVDGEMDVMGSVELRLTYNERNNKWNGTGTFAGGILGEIMKSTMSYQFVPYEP